MSEGEFDELIEEAMLAAGEDELTRMLLGRFDAPAYVRRGLRLEATLQRCYERLESRRRELLAGVALSLRLLGQTITGPDDLSSYVSSPGELETIRKLFADFGSEVKWAQARARPSMIMGRLRDLKDSIRRFNRLWLRELRSADLKEVNREIEDYNRYYLLEKECALRSPGLAARGFKRVPPLTHDALLERFPLLPVPGQEDQREQA